MSNMHVSAEAKSVRDIFSKFFDIPAYQRDYVWKDDNIEAFFNDILESYKDNASKDYFMGSLLLARKEDSTSFSIIDGQQRLTTSYIFLKLLVDF